MKHANSNGAGNMTTANTFCLLFVLLILATRFVTVKNLQHALVLRTAFAV